MDLIAYTDSDWGGSSDRRSITGSSIWYGNNLLSWSAKKQPAVSNSSAEAEFKAITHVTSDVRWFYYLFRELEIKLSFPPTLLCDSKSAIFMAKNPAITSCSRHIEISYYFVRELINKGIF